MNSIASGARSGVVIPAIPPGVKLTTLANGLTIIVREDHSAPVVSAQAWCMSGSIHEGSWLGAGLSHVLEHMLFKGTTRRPGSRIDQEVQEAGGYMNAYTSFDRTVYHIDVPNTGARVALDILCDIMQNASLPADELAKEMQVIVREMDMNMDDPQRRASRRLFETAYTKSPYRFTVIGYPDIFHLLKPEDISNYYHEKYAPNNVFFVVVGDVQADEVVAQIREAYAQAKAKPLPALVLPSEPRQMAPREIIEEAAVELANFHFAWHIPDIRHPDVPVLDIVAALLGNGRSSRLFRQLREAQGLVHYIDAWTYSPGNPGLLGISGMADAEKFAAARDAALEQIEQIQATPVEPEELAKAVKQFTSATLASRKTMQGQAQDLGANWLSSGDLGFSERYLDAVRRATPEDVQRVACRYLVPENRTVYALVPEGKAPEFALKADVPRQSPAERFELTNGLRLLVKEDHRLPFVEFRAVFRGGLLAEEPQNNGITQLTARMLLKGTKARSAEDISREIESIGGSIDSYAGNNSFGVSAEVLSADFTTGLDVLGDVLLNSRFPEESLERERDVQLAGIRAQRDHLLQSATRLMRRKLFGPVGYGLDTLGTESSVQQLTAAELRSFYQRLGTPGNCVLAIYGDVEAEAVREQVERVFGGWTGPTASLPTMPEKERTALERTGETRDKKQAVLVLGHRGTTIFDRDRYALELLQEACSDLGSRLFLRIREKLGLAYYVGAQNFLGLAPGAFYFYAGTAPDKAGLVEQELFAEADLLRTEGLTLDELKRAKAKVIGQKKIARQDLGGLAMTNGLDELYGLGFNHLDSEDERYEAVTLEDIRRVAQTYLKPELAVIATILPEQSGVETA